MISDIFTYITQQETLYQTDEIRVLDNWNWNMRNHIQMSLMLKYGVFTTGDNNWLRPFKKIIYPLLNIRYRAEDIEVKDIVLYADHENGRVLSFFLKRYYEDVYIKENNLDTLIDKMGKENITLGGVLVQKGKELPEVLPLVQLAFCDQTDIKNGAIGFKHYFSVDSLKKMSSLGWGETKNGATISIDDLVILAQNVKDAPGGNNKEQNKVPSKAIEVYIVRGNFPESYLKDDGNTDKSKKNNC